MEDLEEVDTFVNQEKFDLQVIIASGLKNMDRAVIGLALALSSASSGGKVVVFLCMEAAAFANPREGLISYITGFESIQKYFDLLMEEGATIEACTSCVENYCMTRKIKNKKKIRAGFQFAGISRAALRTLNTPTVVF